MRTCERIALIATCITMFAIGSRGHDNSSDLKAQIQGLQKQSSALTLKIQILQRKLDQLPHTPAEPPAQSGDLRKEIQGLQQPSATLSEQIQVVQRNIELASVAAAPVRPASASSFLCGSAHQHQARLF